MYVFTSSYNKPILANDIYYYAIMGSSTLANSSILNCLSIDVTLGSIENFIVNFGLLLVLLEA